MANRTTSISPERNRCAGSVPDSGAVDEARVVGCCGQASLGLGPSVRRTVRRTARATASESGAPTRANGFVPTKSRGTAAFTLTELMVASGLGLIALLAVGLLAFYTSRSFVAMANYVNMDQRSQVALDKMSKEIRQARGLSSFSPTSITIRDVDNKLVQFTYEPNTRRLVRVSGVLTNVYLADCDSLRFTNFQGTAISNWFEAYPAAYVTDAKIIQVTWICSRTILGAKANTESVQSAKITLRNNTL